MFPAVSGGARSGARSEATSSDEGAVERWYTSLDSMPCNGRFQRPPLMESANELGDGWSSGASWATGGGSIPTFLEVV